MFVLPIFHSKNAQKLKECSQNSKEISQKGDVGNFDRHRENPLTFGWPKMSKRQVGSHGRLPPPPKLNASFTKRILWRIEHTRRDFVGGAHHHPEDDRFSSASEASSSCAGSASAQPGANTSSSSVRLNDVGDVQQLARMQEESTFVSQIVVE